MWLKTVTFILKAKSFCDEGLYGVPPFWPSTQYASSLVCCTYYWSNVSPKIFMQALYWYLDKDQTSWALFMCRLLGFIFPLSRPLSEMFPVEGASGWLSELWNGVGWMKQSGSSLLSSGLHWFMYGKCSVYIIVFLVVLSERQLWCLALGVWENMPRCKFLRGWHWLILSSTTVPNERRLCKVWRLSQSGDEMEIYRPIVSRKGKATGSQLCFRIYCPCAFKKPSFCNWADVGRVSAKYSIAPFLLNNLQSCTDEVTFHQKPCLLSQLNWKQRASYYFET